MLLAHGRDYKQALRDFALVSGPPSLADVQSYGVWHSRYHAYDQDEYVDIPSIAADFHHETML